MAGANNKALKKAGMTSREIETFRASGGKSLRATAAVPGFHVRHWKGDKKERVYVSSSAFKGDAYVEKSGKYFVVTARHNVDSARIERALRKAGLEI